MQIDSIWTLGKVIVTSVQFYLVRGREVESLGRVSDSSHLSERLEDRAGHKEAAFSQGCPNPRGDRHECFEDEGSYGCEDTPWPRHLLERTKFI